MDCEGQEERKDDQRNEQFFLILLSHNNLENYYKLIFNMAQHHGYDISSLESMIPFELDLYSTMLIEFLEKQKEQI